MTSNLDLACKLGTIATAPVGRWGRWSEQASRDVHARLGLSSTTLKSYKCAPKLTRVTLDGIPNRRKMYLNDYPERIEITEQNLSHFKSGKAHSMPSQPLSFMCLAYDCRPGTLLEDLKERGG